MPNRELNVTLQSVVCGALAHPLEIDFLSNSGTRAVNAFATTGVANFLEQHFFFFSSRQYLAADILA